MNHQNSQSFVSQSHFYVSVLQESVKSKDPFSIKLIHGRLIKSGVHLSVFLMNSLINGYAKTGFLSHARKVFDVMPVRDASSWNTILSGYSKGGLINEARSIFKEMPYRDSVSWTTMISGYNFVGRFRVAIQMFLEMVNASDVLPTQYTFTSVLASCAEIRALNEGRSVHSFVVKFGLSSYVSVANSLLNMYAKSGDANAAQIVFDGIEEKNTSSWNTLISLHMQTGRVDLALAQFEQMNEHDIVSWNSMVTGYNQHGYDVLALNMFSRMLKESSLEPDRYTLASALSACANLGELNVGKQIHAHLVRTEFNMSGAVGNSLICMYSRCGDVDIARRLLEKNRESSVNVIAFTALLDGYIKVGDISPARKIFDSLKDRDVVVWTAMIVGYVQNGLNDDAMELFRSMVKEGPDPNNYTLAAMLSVCSSVASLNHGNISCSRRVFDLIHLNRDTISWSSMILALAQHGLGTEAIQLFENMLALGMKPDHITYVGVLTACTHVGLVAQGRSYYKMMKEMHGIEPTSSHCACMIDLFGRAGLLEEAQEFIENMPIEPDVIAWGSLLASCRVHKKVELAKIAADRLLSIDPENSGAYSALANVYSACGKWEEAAKIRKSMKDKQVKKEQGFSWIQIKNVVHVFGVEDALHPQRDAIFKTMEKIWEDIKKMGFIPDTESVLHDLDYEVKEQILRHHSEKLAIAFGLINTPENTTLRIMKNLRVCNDCHLAIKFLSKLVGREIILRDATRFHHFKGGFCSCHDYW